MKKILFILLISIVTIVGCNNDDSEIEPKVEPKVESIYYAKYNISAGNNTHFCKFALYFTDSYNKISIRNYGENTTNSHGSKSYSDEIIVGPFKQNDTLKLSINNTVSVYYYNMEIYVSKDNSPFALKAQTNTSSLEYIIDF